MAFLAVFPAYAGMFRCTRAAANDVAGFPRIRGDVPNAEARHRGLHRFSPHTRGCSCGVVDGCAVCPVFPAYAGMFPAPERPPSLSLRFPRIRGDVPSTESST